MALKWREQVAHVVPVIFQPGRSPFFWNVVNIGSASACDVHFPVVIMLCLLVFNGGVLCCTHALCCSVM
jgi:hypothetical protein